MQALYSDPAGCPDTIPISINDLGVMVQFACEDGAAIEVSNFALTAASCLVAEHCWDLVGLAIVEYAYRFERLRRPAQEGG